MNTLVRYAEQVEEQAADRCEKPACESSKGRLRTTLTVVLSINLVVIAATITLVTLLIKG